MKIPTVKVVLINTNALALKVTIPNTKKYKFKNLEQRIELKQWDGKARQCKKGHSDGEDINRMIATKRNELVDLFKADKKAGANFTAEHIANRIAGITYNPQNFYEFCREQIELKNYKRSTKKNYKGEVSKMEKHSPTLSFSEITFKWLQGYENYMRSDKIKNTSNTVWKSLKFINTMIIRAIKIGGIIDKNPFKEYNRGKFKQGIPVFLEWDEIQTLHKTIKEKKMPERTRLIGYYSLLSYYSGLRFSDAVKFDYKTKVIEDAKGKRLLLYATKNGEIVSIAFNKYISEVVEYIKDKPIQVENKEFNDALKDIARIADIDKDISSHTARHSFAMRCAELDVSIERTQKLMGHIQQKSTAIYYRVKNISLDSDMLKWEL